MNDRTLSILNAAQTVFARYQRRTVRRRIERYIAREGPEGWRAKDDMVL